MGLGRCTFRDVVSGRIPANVRHEDDDVVVFDNELEWVPVMLLLVPRRHMSQNELWSDGPLLAKIGSLAARLGHDLCPDGFRILSNFGDDALQTQPHGHIHVIGGAPLRVYVSHA